MKKISTKEAQKVAFNDMRKMGINPNIVKIQKTVLSLPKIKIVVFNPY